MIIVQVPACIVTGSNKHWSLSELLQPLASPPIICMNHWWFPSTIWIMCHVRMQMNECVCFCPACCGESLLCRRVLCDTTHVRLIAKAHVLLHKAIGDHFQQPSPREGIIFSATEGCAFSDEFLYCAQFWLSEPTRIQTVKASSRPDHFPALEMVSKVRAFRMLESHTFFFILHVADAQTITMETTKRRGSPLEKRLWKLPHSVAWQVLSTIFVAFFFYLPFCSIFWEFIGLGFGLLTRGWKLRYACLLCPSKPLFIIEVEEAKNSCSSGQIKKTRAGVAAQSRLPLFILMFQESVREGNKSVVQQPEWVSS